MRDLEGNVLQERNNRQQNHQNPNDPRNSVNQPIDMDNNEVFYIDPELEKELKEIEIITDEDLKTAYE